MADRACLALDCVGHGAMWPLWLRFESDGALAWGSGSWVLRGEVSGVELRCKAAVAIGTGGDTIEGHVVVGEYGSADDFGAGAPGVVGEFGECLPFVFAEEAVEGVGHCGHVRGPF